MQNLVSFVLVLPDSFTLEDAFAVGTAFGAFQLSCAAIGATVYMEAGQRGGMAGNPGSATGQPCGANGRIGATGPAPGFLSSMSFGVGAVNGQRSHNATGPASNAGQSTGADGSSTPRKRGGWPAGKPRKPRDASNPPVIGGANPNSAVVADSTSATAASAGPFLPGIADPTPNAADPAAASTGNAVPAAASTGDAVPAVAGNPPETTAAIADNAPIQQPDSGRGPKPGKNRK